MAGAEAFERVIAELDYPMLIVTTAARGERDGCLVGFATQCSIDPPLYLACISNKNRTLRVLEGAVALVVHLVPRDARDLAVLFGGETGDEVDKFSRCEWHEGPAGLPLLDRCPSWFAGRILDRRPWGDHVAHLLEPFDGEAGEIDELLTFGDVRDIAPGHEA